MKCQVPTRITAKLNQKTRAHKNGSTVLTFLGNIREFLLLITRCGRAAAMYQLTRNQTTPSV
jgi:hypothetical protein